MKISQHFCWEASHRLLRFGAAEHTVHRHAYHLSVALEGEPAALEATEMLEAVLAPLIADWRGAVLVSAEDVRLEETLRHEGRRYVLLPAETTAENLSRFVVDYFCMKAARPLRGYGVGAVQAYLEERPCDDRERPVAVGQVRAVLHPEIYGTRKRLTPLAGAA